MAKMKSTKALMQAIETREIQATRLQDISTAIKLNRLRNAVRFQEIEPEQAVYQFMAVTIWGKFMKEEVI